MSPPLISIIVPIFNRFEVAKRAIKSVCNQTYENWELIIIDDDSKKHFLLPVFLKNIKQNVYLIRNTNNSGPGISRQRGLELAKGDYICFLDCDDYWLSDFLKISLNFHHANEDISATYVMSKYTTGILREFNNLINPIEDLCLGVVIDKRPWATASLMWKRKYLAKWSNVRTNQDAMFEFESSLINSKIKMIQKVLCVVDKDTGENSIDVVGFKKVNRNRFQVLLYFSRNIDKYNGGMRKEIKYYLWFNILNYTKKMLRDGYLQLFLVGIYVLIVHFSWILLKKTNYTLD